MSQYEYDREDFRFRKTRTSVWAVIRKILMFFVATLSLALVYYVIFALVFSTDTEQKLKDENRMFESEFPELQKKEELLSDVIEGLKMKDDRIYTEIFNTSAPNMDPMSSLDFFVGLDSVPDGDIVRYAEKKLDVMTGAAGKLLRSIRLFDIYRGTGIPEGKKSVAFSLELRADDRTLTDTDSEGVVTKVLNALKEKLDISLR